ncbi:MAG TPA: ABATE domain-containing protein [Dongiaceae bacterium]|nr:ABATE domain-containing protein [Dongiaceae bacterium]
MKQDPPNQTTRLIAQLSPGRAGRLPLVAGPLCLNFTNTASGRGTDTHQDHLKAYNDLLAWSLHAGALTPEIALALATLAGREPAAAKKVLRRAVELRECLHVIGTAIAAGETPPAAAVSDFEAAMAQAATSGRLTWNGKNFTWGLDTKTPHLELPLWPIIRSAGEVLVTAPLERLKTCAGVHCGWLFLDETRNGKRRWCEMEVCGSRAKMRRFRARHAAAHDR